jgi:hypothetical protein
MAYEEESQLEIFRCRLQELTQQPPYRLTRKTPMRSTTMSTNMRSSHITVILIYVEIPNRYVGKLRRPLVIFAVVCLVGMGLGFSCGNFVFLSKALSELTGIHQKFIGIGIFALIFFLLIIIREPEKIKVLAYIIAGLIFSIGTSTLTKL